MLLYPPSQTFHVYPFCVDHPRDNYSMVLDPTRVDLRTYPSFARARGMQAELSPGDVLWLPRYYWHHVLQLGDEEENLSLNFWGGRKGTGDFKKEVWEAARCPPPPSAVAAAARTVRSCFG